MLAKCWICVREMPPEITHTHHIKPKHTGGSDEEENLVRICPTCHQMVHTCAYSVLRKKDGGASRAANIVKRAFPSGEEAPLQRKNAELMIEECVQEMRDHAADPSMTFLNRIAVPLSVRQRLEVKAKQRGYRGWRPYLAQEGLATLAGMASMSRDTPSDMEIL